MLKLFILMSLQSAFLVSSQLLLKKVLTQINDEFFSVLNILKLLRDISFYFSIISLAISAFIWIMVVKKYDFNLAYPLVGLSYVYGLFMSKYFLNEDYNWLMLLGTVVILLGIFLLMYGKTLIEAGH